MKNRESHPVRRLAGVVILSLGGAGLAGCGSGSNTSADIIGACPAHYAMPSVEVKDVPTSHAAMQEGVREFLAGIPTNAVASDGTIQGIALSAQQQSAAPALMNKEDPFGTVFFDPSRLKVSQLGQEFCVDGSNTYASPAYQAAEAALKVDGIDVALNPASVTPPSSVPQG